MTQKDKKRKDKNTNDRKARGSPFVLLFHIHIMHFMVLQMLRIIGLETNYIKSLKKETSLWILGKKEDGRGCWQDTYSIQEIHLLSFTFRMLNSKESWLADILSGFSRNTV